jgi:pimeloyl-ACP methyl ester carboxylesterase
MPRAQDIYYREYIGDGERRAPVLLIHGAGGSHMHWPSEIRHISGEHIIAIDLPGHGRSGGDGRDTIAEYTESLITFLDSLAIDKLALAGHSMGAAIILTLCLSSPERFTGIILLGAGARLRVHPAILNNCKSETTFPNVISIVKDWAFSPQADPRLVELAGERMAETPQNVVLGDFVACDEFNIRERLQEIKPQTLIICGDDDKMTPPRFSEYLVDKIPNARLEIIPNAGHMVMLEQPGRVANLMKAFLDEITHLDSALNFAIQM